MAVLANLQQNSKFLSFVDYSCLDSSNKNMTTFLIGKNGSGKSRLLRSIVIHSLKDPQFKKVLAISNTQYHKYPFEWEIAELKDINIDKYSCIAFENFPAWVKYNRENFYKNEKKDADEYWNIRINKQSSIIDPQIFKRYYQEHVKFYKKGEAKPQTFFNNFLYLDSILFNIKNIKNFEFKIMEVLNFIGLDSYIEIHTQINIYEDDFKKLFEKLHFHSNNYNLKDADFLLSILENIDKLKVFSLFSISKELLHYFSILTNLELIKITNIKVQKNKSKIDIYDLSSGEKSILSIMFSLLSNLEHNSLVCIDEPEINLHPEWQEKIIELLERVSSNYYGCHFFIATHSPQIISGIKNNNSFILDLNTNLLNHSSKFKNRSSDFQLSEVFNSPGKNNEYLIRKLIIILNKLNSEENYFLDSDSLALINHIKKLINEEKFDEKDKVSIIFNLIESYRG